MLKTKFQSCVFQNFKIRSKLCIINKMIKLLYRVAQKIRYINLLEVKSAAKKERIGV